jgi:hypothetical protein
MVRGLRQRMSGVRNSPNKNLVFWPHPSLLLAYDALRIARSSRLGCGQNPSVFLFAVFLTPDISDREIIFSADVGIPRNSGCRVRFPRRESIMRTFIKIEDDP